MTRVESHNQVRLFASSFGPYIRLPRGRLAELKQALECRGILYHVEEDMISVDGGPYLAYVHLPSQISPDVINAAIDSML